MLRQTILTNLTILMKKARQFGERVEGYDILVLNEREIRAAAGLLFLVIFLALMLILFNNDFLLAKYAITLFMTDFIIRVFVSPRFSPSLIIGRLIVSKQVPEYVGAQQKKFAWTIGVLFIRHHVPIYGGHQFLQSDHRPCLPDVPDLPFL